MPGDAGRRYLNGSVPTSTFPSTNGIDRSGRMVKSEPHIFAKHAPVYVRQPDEPSANVTTGRSARPTWKTPSFASAEPGRMLTVLAVVKSPP